MEDENNYLNMRRAVKPKGLVGEIDPATCKMLSLLKDMILSAAKSAENFSIKNALVEFLSSLLKHSSGQQWLMYTGETFFSLYLNCSYLN